MKIKIITASLFSLLLTACGSDDDSVTLVNISEADEPNDTFVTAQEIDMNSLVFGRLSEQDSDIADYYLVEVTRTGKLEVRLSGVSDEQQDPSLPFNENVLDADVDVFFVEKDVVVADDCGVVAEPCTEYPSPVESSTNIGNEESITKDLSEVGNYFIKVSSSLEKGSGTYELSVYQK